MHRLHRFILCNLCICDLCYHRPRMSLGVAESILDLIGQTPLLHLSRFAQPPLADIYAKIEWLNPGGSVKDRAALGMILDAEEKGLLKPGATIIEPTAGNTGIGLALVGVARGYRVILCVPRGFAVEKMKLIEALGGEIEYVLARSGNAGRDRPLSRTGGRQSTTASCRSNLRIMRTRVFMNSRQHARSSNR